MHRVQIKLSGASKGIFVAAHVQRSDWRYKHNCPFVSIARSRTSQ